MATDNEVPLKAPDAFRAADVTPEEIKELRKYITPRGHDPYIAELVQRLLDALESAWAERDRLRSELASMNKLVSNVPDLVKSAFQEGFAGNSGGLGEAWENSRARKVLDGEATQRPPSWDADKHRIAVLEAELAAAHEEILLSRQSEGETMADLLRTRAELAARTGAVEVPPDMWAINWSPGCWDLYDSQHEAESVARSGICEVVPLWRSVPPSRLLKDREVAVNQDFLERVAEMVPLVCDEWPNSSDEFKLARSVECDLDALRSNGGAKEGGENG